MHHLTAILRCPAFVHPSTFYHRATTILQWLNSRVLGAIEAFSSYLTRNSKELEQNKASITHHLICQQNMYKLNK